MISLCCGCCFTCLPLAAYLTYSKGVWMNRDVCRNMHVVLAASVSSRVCCYRLPRLFLFSTFVQFRMNMLFIVQSGDTDSQCSSLGGSIVRKKNLYIL